MKGPQLAPDTGEKTSDPFRSDRYRGVDRPLAQRLVDGTERRVPRERPPASIRFRAVDPVGAEAPDPTGGEHHQLCVVCVVGEALQAASWRSPISISHSSGTDPSTTSGAGPTMLRPCARATENSTARSGSPATRASISSSFPGRNANPASSAGAAVGDTAVARVTARRSTRLGASPHTPSTASRRTRRSCAERLIARGGRRRRAVLRAARSRTVRRSHATSRLTTHSPRGANTRFGSAIEVRPPAGCPGVVRREAPGK